MSTAGCPYAQRQEIVLVAKGTDARIREIDFKAPPEGSLARSPLAKVPVHGDESLVESTVINEYLDEVIPAMPLHPNDPALRARMRFLVALGFMDSIYFRDPLGQRIELPSEDGDDNAVVFGRVVGIHIDHAVLVDGRVDINRVAPIGRLGGTQYVVVREPFSMTQPEWR